MKKILPLLLIIVLVIPVLAHAQATTFSVESVGSQVGLGSADAKTVVINILRWILGIMTLVAVAMIIFAGFIAATSDSEDRAATARRVISGAAIGLIIILLAWAIVLFVARTTANVTEGE
jgi:Na+/proline symporter